MRRAAKVDGTQAGIVDALRDRGCRVLSLAGVANGCPDLLVHQPSDVLDRYGEPVQALTLLEVKNPAGRGTGLTPDQVKFHNEWPVTVVTNAEEALKAVGL